MSHPERRMGHQHHFLSRLDRVSAPHVELALSLYRDVDLLRFVLQSAHLPDGAERAAISLQHPTRGPFLIVTRDGHFVTCLGEGMGVGDLPVITREKLNGIAVRASDLRARMEVCAKLAGERGGMGKLLLRIYEAADELSREEFVAISALQPIYAPELFKFFFATWTDINDARQTLARELRKTDRLKPHYRGALRSFWNELWAIGHLSVLCAMDGRLILDRFPSQLGDVTQEFSVSWNSVGQGVVALAMKGVWSAARIGKPLLPGYKQRFSVANSSLTLLDAGMALGALGMRHARLRAEVQKTVAGRLDVPEGQKETFIDKLAKITVKTLNTAFERPEECAAIQRQFGALSAVAAGKVLPAGSPYRFERPEDVPVDLAMTAAVNTQSSFLGDGMSAAAPFMYFFLPWVARAAPESLYLPQDYIKAIHVPWTPDLSEREIRAYTKHYERTAPAKAEGPARKGPCPCGSGKKYKRCCGADDDSSRD